LQYDWWSLQSEGQWEIQAKEVDVNPGKWSWTGDPAPGYEFVYVVNACNSGATDSSQVILSDTLPLSTTLVTWWGAHDGWQEVSASDHQLVVSRPSLQSGWCGDVMVQVYLDEAAWPGMELYNRAEVWSADDQDPGNDVTEHWLGVGNPHTNLHAWRNWSWGRLVPGGEYTFEFNVGNSGNIPVDNVLVTATLPAGTAFLRSYTWNWMGSYPYTPTVITDEFLVWDLGTLPNGYWKDIGVQLAIDPQTPSGAELDFSIEIAPQPLEDRYDDNRRAWTEMVNEPGANLRVDKHTNWRWTWEGQLEYELRIMNMGTQRLDDVVITDTYPLSTTFDGNWWQNHGPEITLTHSAENRQIVFQMNPLHPGETASVGYQFNLLPEVCYIEGLAYTNELAAALPGDVYPVDNQDTVTAYSGPDVFVRKWLSGGEPRPGEVVTFTVEFGNANRWPWNGDWNFGSHLTDTLPDGMTFIQATAPWDPDESWHPELIEGQQVVWGWGAMGAESMWTYQIIAQISETVPGGEVLTNLIEARGDSPDDLEPDSENNLASEKFTVLGPHFQIAKVYQGQEVAGTPITYTLTVENSGNEAGTGVEVIDWLPDWMDYGGGGAYDAGLISWIIPSIDPSGAESVSFWGTLSCQAGGSVSNEFYKVESSEQGLSTAYGPPVSFAIAAPQIVAGFEASSLVVDPLQTITFTSTSTTDGTPLSYAWDFGDGESGAGAAASHSYSLPGEYEVTLTATDGCGFAATANLTIQVASLEVYLPITRR
jgi:uncharacterized repeat protein (TIGR01451 family)